MTVLIITFSKDNESIPLVTKAIEAQGQKVFRFDTDRFPTEVQVDLAHGSSDRLIITDGDKSLDTSEVSAIWYRRARYAHALPEDMDAQYRKASMDECRVILRGMFSCIEGFWFDRIRDVEIANNKQLQLRIARELGLQTPRTLTTNNPQALRQFFAESKGQEVVAKMLASFAIYDEGGAEQVMFTNLVDEQGLENLDGLRFCPMTFQENIPKAVELRATIVGDQIFTAAVDSQSLEDSAVDWRKEGRALLKSWKPYELPDDIKTKLFQLTARLNLNYGAIDIIVRPDGQHVFLEINPVGEFFWMELYSPHFPISQAIADMLVAKGQR